jgi:hypothetical protein
VKVIGILPSHLKSSVQYGASVTSTIGYLNIYQYLPYKRLTALLQGFFGLQISEETVQNVFPNGLPETVLVGDSSPAQLKTPTKQKQLCTAHLLRELKNFETAVSCSWSKSVKQLLKEAILLEKELKPNDYSRPNQQVQQIEKRLDHLLLT